MEDNKNDIPNDDINEQQDNSTDEQLNQLSDDKSETIDFEEIIEEVSEVIEEKRCYNCDSVMSSEDKYCSNCGQKHTTGKIPVWTFIYNFFQNTFNIDAKLPKTLGNLLIFPGRLTKEFFKGRHQSFLKPVQLFVFMTLLCFTIIAFKTSDFNSKFTLDDEEKRIQPNIQFNEGENQIYFLMGMDSAKIITDSLLNIAKKTITSSQVEPVLDTLFQPWFTENSLSNDSMILPVSLRPGNEQTLPIAKKDLVLMSSKELIKAYNIEGFWEQILFIQVLKSVKHEEELLDYFVGHLSWAFFLLVPLFALILKLVYIRRKQFYVEHLVFTLHFHAFAFTIFSLILLLKELTPSWFRIALIIYVPIYLLISMKTVYQQGFFKTMFKYILLLISYLFLFTIALLITMSVAFILF